MEIRVLKYFLTVAEIGNITKAANSMHLTQPTLSRQLQDLERELGQKLFVRGSKSVTLTPEGMVLRRRAQEIMELVEKTENEFFSIKDDVSGDIFIGAGETKTIKLIADVMKTLQKKYQKIKFHIVSGDSEDLSEKLDKGILDFCIFIEPFVPDKYNYINLSEKDTWGILLRQDDPLAKKESIKVEDIINLPILISRQAIKKSFENNPILDWFGDNFDKMHIAGTYNLLYNAAIMTENEIGYALGLDRLIADTLNSPLTFRPLNPKLQVCVSIAWKKNQVFSKAAKLFLDEMNVKFN
ncbi:TPA: LysR family transcriptional regulator [Candidatus Galligastranaerophilus intestinavium]|uniref:LysR family transcriptional regulator n=1 Tax=Candidatus Galligastranaerophilus intestinavium TaxID=2840836 RepID=A0A9D1JYI8_9BACT|nr:LysR family transcriptional regulator [Candidatus Galligastranaerophilus intestinavium]